MVEGTDTRYFCVERRELSRQDVVFLRTKLNNSRICSRLSKMVLEVVQDRSKWRLGLFGSSLRLSIS